MKYSIKLAKDINRGDRIVMSNTGHYVEERFTLCEGAGSFLFGKYGFFIVHDHKLGRCESLYSFENCPIVILNYD